MKNLLSENMLRFGTKNLTESAKRKLVFESIMQTINEHGLRGAVGRSLLTEGDAPNKGFVFKDLDETDVEAPGVKFGGTQYEEDYGVLAYQSSTSLSEAQQIIQKLIPAMSKGGAQVVGKQLASILGQITANNYYMILWKVRYGSSFKSITKSNYQNLSHWIGSKGMDIPSTEGGGIMTGIRNLFQDPTVFNAVNRLGKYNFAEYINNSMDFKRGGTALG